MCSHSWPILLFGPRLLSTKRGGRLVCGQGRAVISLAGSVSVLKVNEIILGAEKESIGCRGPMPVDLL
jgi:hypothetical protein